MPYLDTQDFYYDPSELRNRAALGGQTFGAPVLLPQAANVTKVTLFGYRNDALADLELRLYRTSNTGTSELMAEIIADWTTGYSSGYDDTITNPQIDNKNYQYVLTLALVPNDDVLDVRLVKAQIDWN